MICRFFILLPAICLTGLFATGPSVADEAEDDSAQKCIRARKLKSTVVLDDANILFFMVGKTVYHNVLPKQCRGLFKYKTFVFERTAGRVCAFDQIEVHGGSASVGRICRLGEFWPINPDDIRPLIEALHAGPTPNPLPPADVEDVPGSDDPEDAPPN